MSQHIVAFQAQNIKRLTAFKVALDPTTRTVIISGQNAQGKSSVLDAICMALCGKEAIPGQPIHAGADSGKIVLQTEELTITRTFTPNESYLTVSNKDGFQSKSPQQVLESMIERVGFDPLAFGRMDAKKQAATLLKIFPAPIDLADNASRYKNKFDERADANRELKRLYEIVRSMRTPADDTPEQEISIDEISKELTRLRTLEL